MLLVVLIATLLQGISSSIELSDSLCNGNIHCSHNQSALCDDNPILNCDNQLHYEYGRCQIKKIAPSDCYIEAPSYLSSPDDMPFNLQMYYYRTWMEARAVPNLTFPLSEWENLKFQYQRRDNSNKTLCRRFSLDNITLPSSDTLMWDCPFFTEPDFADHSFDLSVITDEGKGGRYAFRVPERERFNPWDTVMKDWHVFFFLHIDHMHQSVVLPVTIQLAPFRNLSYNVSLAKCLSDDWNCNERAILASLLVENHEIIAVTIGSTKQTTVLLPSWSDPATYAVTVQIASSECPKEGCYVSVSPTFEVKASQWTVWLCFALGSLLIFFFVFAIVLHQLSKKREELHLELQQNSPTVLLLYLPENHICLDLVKMLASFLKDTCYVHPCVIDIDVGNQNPNSWTSEHMNKADRLVFLVPGNPNGESITPIRGQWLYALRYLSGHYFATNHLSDKVATITFPFSADVPYEIAHVQRFELVKDMKSLVTWIHNGSWMQKQLFWGPQIRSQRKVMDKKGNPCSLSQLSQLVNQALEVTKSHKGASPISLKPNGIVKLDISNGLDSIPPTAQLLTNEDETKTLDVEELNDTILMKDSKENPFDPDIPDVDELLSTVRESENEGENDDASSVEYSDLDDSYFM